MAAGAGPAKSVRVLAGEVRHTILFAHDASRGTFHKGSRKGEYILTLHGVPSTTLFFADRPGRVAGKVRTRHMLDGFFVRPGAIPPNAAVNVTDLAGRQHLVALELIGAAYSPRHHRIVYRAHRLHGDEPKTIAHRRIDGHDSLPARFGHVSVFIDTFYNQCQGGLLNDTYVTYTMTSDTKYSDDSWTFDDGTDGTPPATIAARFDTNIGSNFYGGYWQTTSGWARGCWNDIIYTGSDGSVIEIYISSPYSGEDQATCTVTNPAGGNGCFVDYNQSTLTDPGNNPDSVWQCNSIGPPIDYSGGVTYSANGCGTFMGRVGTRPSSTLVEGDGL
jgi:hypothetical protein